MSLPVVIRDAGAATPRYRFLAQRAWAANAAVQQRVGGLRELGACEQAVTALSKKATVRQMPRLGSYSVAGSCAALLASVSHR